jgi:type IV secretory pathway TraG/TraD family ATPase VirD4
MIKSSQFAFQGLATAVLVLSSLWIATQWAAAALRFHPALGAPWLALFD